MRQTSSFNFFDKTYRSGLQSGPVGFILGWMPRMYRDEGVQADIPLKQMAGQWKEQQANQYEKQRTGGVYNAVDDFLKK